MSGIELTRDLPQGINGKAAADPGMSVASRSVGFLDVQSSTPAEPSVARLVSMPVCAASLRNPMRNAGWGGSYV